MHYCEKIILIKYLKFKDFFLFAITFLIIIMFIMNYLKLRILHITQDYYSQLLKKLG